MFMQGLVQLVHGPAKCWVMESQERAASRRKARMALALAGIAGRF